jgi:hypothetical protein
MLPTPDPTRSDGLFEYGITTEHSDIRAHVSVVNRTVYVFQTQQGIRTIRSGQWPLRSASQPGVAGITADGWCVDVNAIEDLRRLKFFSWEGWTQFRRELSTSRKGALAVLCVIAAMQRGRFPFWVEAAEDRREDVQVQGTDILVFCRKKIQVKCDFDGGDKPAGTGNLFLQRAERNPLKHR